MRRVRVECCSSCSGGVTRSARVCTRPAALQGKRCRAVQVPGRTPANAGKVVSPAAAEIQTQDLGLSKAYMSATALRNAGYAFYV